MKKTSYPTAIDASKVGTYPAFTKSGAGYFYDDVLEYRVWVHPERGGEDKENGEDYFYCFVMYEDALEFSKNTKGAEEPIALVLQKEHINEPQKGVFEHVKTERITEWPPALLADRKRGEKSIENFLKRHE